MNRVMTRNTNRDNIKPILRVVSQVMVIVLRSLYQGFLKAREAEQSIGARQLAGTHSSGDSICSKSLFGIPKPVFFMSLLAFFTFGIFLYIFTSRLLSFVALLVFLKSPALSIFFLTNTEYFFAFCSLLIFPYVYIATDFALRLKIILFGSVFVKPRKRFNLLALRAWLCYDCFRHGFSPLQKSYCFKPVASTPCGRLVLLYHKKRDCQWKTERQN